MLTSHGTVDLAVEAMRRGAADFMLKPFDREELVFVAQKAITGARGAAEAPPRRAPEAPDGGEILGDEPAMREVRALIERAARSNATVLIRGESGTGKELVARAIHARSPRAEGPLVCVHCGALPDNLLESELFGYEKGAFTGAAARKPGRVELAAGGTLFLDEIGDVTPATQVKLLRVLQARSFERLGGTETLRADVRFVAATHRDLDAMVASGAFREDLFYRLQVVPIWVPPLRERAGDIPRMARHFARAIGAENGRPGVDLRDDAAALLAAQPWPGNVRQLQNFIERLVVLGAGDVVTADDVRRELARAPRSKAPEAPREPHAPPPATAVRPLEERLREVERDALVEALRAAGQNRTQAARLLGISRRSLYEKLAEHQITGA